ncbi:MAG: non-canonical purine NTP pyrophosphatase [Planctomycetota bacterium]
MAGELSRIVIATGNPHKVAELEAIFADVDGLDGVELVGLADLPGPDGGWREPIEDSGTIEGNSELKALDYAEQTGLPCIADDSGLEVDALGGAPGVISSHYCTDGEEVGWPRDKRDAENNAKLLREMEGVKPELRTAKFVCVMTLAMPGRDVVARTRGEFVGQVGESPAVPRGEHGFGYDPLFLVGPEHTLTAAELPKAEKNAISHRAKAARAMAKAIARIVKSEED